MAPNQAVYWAGWINQEGRNAPTVDIFGSLQVNPQDSPRAQGEYEHIIGNLGSDKVGSDRKGKLHGLDVEDGQLGDATVC